MTHTFNTDAWARELVVYRNREPKQLAKRHAERRMGCLESKTKEPPEFCGNDAQLPEASRVLKPSDFIHNGKGKNTKKKGKFTKYRFDPVVSEKYEIKATIGRGSFARVVRVENKETKQPYAIKVIENHGSKEVFESDIDVLRRLKHPNIVQHYEVFECPGRLYVVMELATGGELFERIVSKGYFTERDATRVLYMVLDGVQYLHSQGITHRDLKPENLLYYHPGNDSKIMITDFGFAKSLQNPGDRTMETTCGSPEYFAPEMLTEMPYTNAVDMWAVGVITYILLSGNMPFADDSQARLYRQIKKAKYSYRGEPWRDVSHAAKDFIDRLLVLDPETRLTAEDAVKHHWIASNAALSSQKNLHGSFTQNWRKHSASRNGSARSNRSQRSSKSTKSRISNHSQKGTVCIQTEGSLASATKRRHVETQLKTGGGTRDTQVKMSKQLLENCHSNTSESKGKFPIEAHSNQMDAMNNTLLSIQEIPHEEETGSCPQNDLDVFSDLESSHCKEETPASGNASTGEQGASSDGSEPAALQTMRDNFFSSSELEDTEKISVAPKLGLQNEEFCRSAKLDGNRVLLELPQKPRVYPLSPILRTNRVSCSEDASEQ